MPYDYSELRGLIRFNFGNLADFAEAIGVSTTSLNDRLQGRLPFRQNEILKAKQALNLDPNQLDRIFFRE